MQKIISWNVASIRARMLALEKLLAQENPDIVCLQEIKSEENNFPFFELKTLGYEAVINGQKSYNGVAILSKEKLININTKLMDEEVPQARFIEAQMSDGTVVISVYVPNGNPPEKDPEDKTRLAYKLKWMNALNKHIKQLLSAGNKVILGGDFNVIERDTDVYNPDLFRDNALMLPEVREVYGELTSLPITNAIRLKNPEPNTYSFWDFQMGAWPRNKGILLDALFINSDREKMIESAGVYKEVRGWDKTSDHAPIYLALK
ncbi:MAG: exodeoxyribonuclease III [Alphaproteobacteria bacterium]|nr:exodeoxyribonuclease III [Alphaproteobacteria bacterium]